MGIKQLYNDNLRKLPNEYGEVSVMSAKPRPMINVISQSLGLDVVNINAYAKFYHNIPNG